jgi:hypothetical protein
MKGSGMASDELETYLNDHLAGAASAIQMLERAVDDHAGTDLGAQLAELLGAIREDREALRQLVERLGYPEHSLKQAGAWLAEKVGRLKVGASQERPLARLELMEMLALGIYGKVKLWRALRAVAPRHPAVQELDLRRLDRRAQEQHDLVEAWRIEAAEAAL